MAVIEVRGLRKEYRTDWRRRTVALDGLDFEVPQGVVFGFLGPNGAGKTTTIRCLLDLVRPTAGRCQVLGVDPQVHVDRVQRRVGSLIESQALFPAFSGRRNLTQLARLHRVPRARVDAVLDRVGLARRADDPVRAYSLGMRQRLGLAAALLKDPELLILDEPTNGLDPAGMRDMRALLRDLGERGHTVLLSSHLLGEVQQLCDRVGVISGGRLLAETTVDDLLGQAGLLVRAVPAAEARACLERLVGAGNVAQADGAFRLRTGPEQAGRVSRTLADAGVTLTELRPLERTLEEVFLEMTGTGRAGR